MQHVYGDPEVMRHVADGRRRDRAATARMLAGYIAGQRARGWSFWAVVERETGRVIGDAGLAPMGEEVELGYTFARAAWGQGYATEAAGACLAFAREQLPGRPVVALVDPANLASQHVLEKLGFTAAGERPAFGRPHLLFRA